MIWLIPSFIAGAIFRRWWGGFCQPARWLKKVVGFVLPFAVAYPLSGLLLWASLIASASVGLSWWALGGMHGRWQRFGRGGDPPFWDCFLYMGLNYSIYSTVAAVALAHFSKSPLPLIYCPFGFLVSLSYAFSYWLWEILKLPESSSCYLRAGVSVENGQTQPNCFLNGPTSLGECFLGGFMLGGLALASSLP